MRRLGNQGLAQVQAARHTKEVVLQERSGNQLHLLSSLACEKNYYILPFGTLSRTHHHHSTREIHA